MGVRGYLYRRRRRITLVPRPKNERDVPIAKLRFVMGFPYVTSAEKGVNECSKFVDKQYIFCGQKGGERESKNPKILWTS